MIFLLMSHNSLPVVVLPMIQHLAEAQTTVPSSPDESLRAGAAPAGKKGDEELESRVDILIATGETLRWKSFASYDGERRLVARRR
jgi:hypothetical protein